MRKTCRCHVAKRKPSGFRYTIGKTSLSKKDLETFDRLWFDFSPKLEVVERKTICKLWSHKELLPEHKIYLEE